jgi:hypothetical protein
LHDGPTWLCRCGLNNRSRTVDVSSHHRIGKPTFERGHNANSQHSSRDHYTARRDNRDKYIWLTIIRDDQ